MIRWLINIWAAVSLLAAVALGASFVVLWGRHFSARAVPSAIEANVAMAAYDSSTPSKYKEMSNPLPSSTLDLMEAGGHYEEHCAVCHGDDGSGEPKFHGILYPRPTDLRSEDTQEMSDGELYWVIKNGVRWSGMPAFGKSGDNDTHAWKIVAYVRHLPRLTRAEEQQVLERATQPMNHNGGSPDGTR